MRQMPFQKEKVTKLKSLLPAGFGAKSKGEPDQDDMKRKKKTPMGLFGKK